MTASRAQNAAAAPTVAAPVHGGSSLEAGVGRAALLTVGGLGGLTGHPIASPAALLPFLVAAAGVCVALLAIRRVPSLAWLAAIGASYAAATLWFARARSLTTDTDVLGWTAVVGCASLWAIATVWTAARYAARPGNRLDPIAGPLALALVVWVVVACVTTVGVVLAGQRAPDPAFNWIDVATVPIAFFLPIPLALTLLGVLADLRAGVVRARARTEPLPGSNLAERLWALAVATGRELVPGQAAAEEAVLAAERTRLAGDLHAVVLPSLRRAIAEAEAGGDPEAVARHLRAVDLELERLMADRWPVVLEAFGLVRALEDLAERLEADGSPPVTIEVERGGAGDRQPAPVERAAWRFAQVTLDNAVRHAAASAITVSVATAPDRLHLVVADDGRGLSATPSPQRPHGRGLPDATRRAADVGATVEVRSRPTNGTEATFDWSAPARR